MSDQLLNWLGYIASMIVLVSLLMSSIKKLRWINLVGALLFGIYGFMINSLPTGFMNLGIVIIDVYYLAKIYLSKEYFEILPFKDDSGYVTRFLDFYQEDLNLQTTNNKDELLQAEVKFYILRNMQSAGLFIGKEYSEDTLEVLLDYAIPQYRDFKLGDYIFNKQTSIFTDRGYKKLVTFVIEESHMNYIKKMGFIETNIDNKIAFVKEIN